MAFPESIETRATVAAESYPIPAIIKRNMWLIGAAQAAVGTAMQLIPTLGALMAVRLSGSTSFAGAAGSMLGLSRMLVTYPVGAITDRYGRKVGLFLGILLSLVGTVLAGFSMVSASLELFLVGMLIFGCGAGAVQQLRVAATDMFPPGRRAEGVGYLLTGSLLGTFGGSGLISMAQALAPGWNLDAMALSWFLAPAVFIPAAFFVLLVRPDPRDIAMNLQRYYPGYHPPLGAPAEVTEAIGFRGLVRDYPIRTAFIAFFAVQGNMSMMMTMTALVLDHHGHDLPAISLSIAGHVTGMFGLSLPLGALTDRIGRRWVMLIGVLIAGGGSMLVVATPDYWIITLGIFLVGVGWSAVSIASTALIADRTAPRERGRAIGASDTFSGAANITFALAAGPVAAAFGLPMVGIIGMAMMLPPLMLLLRLREPSPGQYLIRSVKLT